MVEDHGYSVVVKQTLIEADEGLLSKLQYNAVWFAEWADDDQELIVVDLYKPIPDDCVTAGEGTCWFQDNDYHRVLRSLNQVLFCR